MYLIGTLGFVGAAFAYPRWAFLGFLFLYSTFSRFLAVGVSDEGFALSVQFLTSLALLGVWITLWLLGDTRVHEGLRRLRRDHWIWVALWGVFVVKVIASAVHTRFEVGVISALVNEYLITINVALFAAMVVRTGRDVVIVCIVIAGSMLFNEVWTIAEQLKGGSLFEGIIEISYKVVGTLSVEGKYREMGYRVMGTFTNPLQLSSFLCIAAPFAVIALRARRRLTRWAVVIPALALTPVSTFWTLSRSGLLTLGIVAASYLLFVFYQRSRIDRTLRFIVLAVALVGAAYSGLAVLDAVNKATVEQSIDITEDKSALYRLAQYVIVGEMLTAHPTNLALGFGMQRNMIEARDELVNLDNYYLRVALEGGLFGVGALLFLCYVLFTCAARLGRHPQKEAQRISVALRSLVVAVLITMVFVSVPYSYLYLYLALALVALYRVSLDEHARQRSEAAAL
ncbi:MAG: O-antigen ligase family protein [Bacteroidota bacterium]